MLKSPEAKRAVLAIATGLVLAVTRHYAQHGQYPDGGTLMTGWFISWLGVSLLTLAASVLLAGENSKLLGLLDRPFPSEGPRRVERDVVEVVVCLSLLIVAGVFHLSDLGALAGAGED